MKHLVVRRLPEADPAVVEALATEGVATVHEVMGRTGLMRPAIRPIFEGAQLTGRAVTVLATAGDNWMIHAAIEVCSPGDVLVVAVTAECTDGMVGDILATMMQARGVAGLVIDAGCRDVRHLREMRFPVWCKAISAQGTVKNSLGAVNLPVVCAGALVRGGDIIVADDDGVVVVPRQQAEEVAAAAVRRGRLEEDVRRRIASGERALMLSDDVRKRLSDLGMTWVDTLDDVPA
jgi:4-hydroxy-4-methyl-2-oxoglutarate aldolase